MLGSLRTFRRNRRFRVTTRYNFIAGQSIERIAALSDGVFAVAMTLLVLDLHAPAEATIHGESELWQALLALAPKVLIYLMSFLTLGIFWVGQQAQIHYLDHGNRDLTWLQLGFLFGISLMPFSTSFMAEFIDYRVALLLYWANILFLGVMLYASWRYAQHAKLLKSELPVEIACAIERRILIAQAFYAFGALLCVVNTYWSLACIIIVQLYYVIAPRLRRSA
jgi:uncharacterized membrane protein